jgi:putative NIF3 family GTP cyclohydrolase 1 type 2
VDEWRLEVVCPQERVGQAVAALRQAHSYEEPAYDVYPLQSPPGPGGEGRVGTLAKPMTLATLVKRVKSGLKVKQVQMVGDSAKSVHKVALACGAAGEFLRDAANIHADVFLTGEMRFHDYLAARAQNIALILPGHYATERFGVEELAQRLQQQFPTLTVWASKEESDPASWA